MASSLFREQSRSHHIMTSRPMPTDTGIIRTLSKTSVSLLLQFDPHKMKEGSLKLVIYGTVPVEWLNYIVYDK